MTSLYPGEARVLVRGKAARAVGDQIRSVDKTRLRARLGPLSRNDLLAVEEAVRVTLDMGWP